MGHMVDDAWLRICAGDLLVYKHCMCCSRMIFDFTRPEKDNQALAGRTNDDHFDVSSMKNLTVNGHLLSPDSGNKH